MKPEHKIVFQPSGRTVYVLPGTTIFEAAARAGLVLQSPCGGKGTCGKCRVKIVKGDCREGATEEKVFGAKEIEQGYRLACQARILGDCVIEVPVSSLYENRSQILTAASGDDLGGTPCIRKTFVELPPPTNEDDVADLRRIERVTGRLHVHLDAMAALPDTLRKGNFSGTAVICGDRLIAFEQGNTEASCYGIAFDLGTTTVVGTLVDLVQHSELAVAAAMNPQIRFGDDVISRISRAREEPGAVAGMQAAVVATLNDLIGEMTDQCGIDRRCVYEVTVAGNTTMQHLFCGISPAALGEVPFPPAYYRGLFLMTREVGLEVHPNARLFVFPNIGGFVGGDTVAGILANALQSADKPAMLIDIGTNGEIVLAHGGKLLATSTAAGPAFEGARIGAGMRATDGAIEKVVMNESDIEVNIIGNTLPAGLCGTALIDLAAVLLRLGALDTTGRLLPPEELPDGVPEGIRARLHQRNSQTDFLLAAAEQSRTGEDIYLCQKDLRELQLATGAIRAGANIMLRKAGLTADDLSEVLLAGGFGNFIRRSNAQRIGLLPHLPSERIRFVGNASSMGAKAVLRSVEQRAVAERIAESAEHVDLSLDPEFQMEFGMAMMFPDSEVG